MTGGAGVVRSRRRVLVDELEILGLHPQLLRRQHPEGHDRTSTALLGTGDDHAGAVAVDLDVRTGRTGEARPPRDRDADGLAAEASYGERAPRPAWERGCAPGGEELRAMSERLTAIEKMLARALALGEECHNLG